MVQDIPDDLLGGVDLWTYLIIKVLPAERVLEYPGIKHGQILLDIMLYLGCGCGCQSDDGSCTDLVDNGADTPVLRPEIMTPFGNTMSFINRIE